MERLLPVRLPLELILENLDGISAINLGNVSTGYSDTVQDILSGNYGQRYWTKQCIWWNEDPMLLMVVASYDSVFPKKIEGELRESKIAFSWSDAFRAAHDVVSVIRSSSLKLNRLKVFQDKIKTDIVFQYESGSLNHEFPSRFTGTSGTVAWNILCPAADVKHNPENVTIFDEMGVCRGTSITDHEQVCSSFLMLLPEAELEGFQEPTMEKVDRFLVWRVLVSVGRLSLYLTSIHGGGSCRIPFDPYTFVKPSHEMNPAVSCWRDILVVWSSPYSLKAFKIIVEPTGDVNAELAGTGDSNDGNFRDRLGCLWVLMAQSVGSFIFSVEEASVQSIIDESTRNKVEITVTFPSQGCKYVIRLQPDQSVDRVPLDFVKDVRKYSFNDGDPLVGTAQAHGLRIYYSSQVLGVSRDGNRWNFREWKDLNLASDPDVTLVEIIGPNLLVIVSEEILYFAQVSIIERSSEVDKSKVELEIIRRVNPKLVEFGNQIKNVRMDFKHAVPYIWLEASRIKLSDAKVVVDGDPCSFDLYRLDFC